MLEGVAPPLKSLKIDVDKLGQREINAEKARTENQRILEEQARQAAIVEEEDRKAREHQIAKQSWKAACDQVEAGNQEAHAYNTAITAKTKRKLLWGSLLFMAGIAIIFIAQTVMGGW